jgi:hypothetical protein
MIMKLRPGPKGAVEPVKKKKSPEDYTRDYRSRNCGQPEMSV